MRGRMWKLAIYLFLLGFILNLLGIVTHELDQRHLAERGQLDGERLPRGRDEIRQ